MKNKIANIRALALTVLAILTTFSCKKRSDTQANSSPDTEEKTNRAEERSSSEGSLTAIKPGDSSKKGTFFSKKYRSGFGNDSRLMTDEESRNLPIEYFGLPFPEGTEIIGGVYDMASGELGQGIGFSLQSNEVESFLEKVRDAWRDPSFSGSEYIAPVETIGAIDSYFWGHDSFSEETVTMQLTSKAIMKKRFIRLVLDPETGHGSMLWTRE